MSKEFSVEKLGKTELQPVIPVQNDVESVASGGAGVPNLSDRQENTWSETSDGLTNQYTRVPMNMDAMMSYGVQVTPAGTTPDYSNPKNQIARNQAGETKYTVEGDAPEAGRYHKDRYVSKDPIKMAATDVPSFSALVSKDPQGTTIEMLQGTLQSPNLNSEIDQTTLFIDGTTSADDVHQGNVGDCYFLSAMLQVIHYDPSKIVNMMSLLGEDVTTKFYYKEKEKWKPVTITTKLGFIKRNNFFMGSMARVSCDPKTSIWSSAIDGSILRINKEQYYEAALWVNCIEQAFTIFTKQYGQYGDGVDPSRPTEKFASIESGNSSRCLHIFYGDDASDYEASATAAPEADQDVVQANSKVISDLLDLAKSQDGDAKRDVHMMAITQPDAALARMETHYTLLNSELQKACSEAPDNEELNASLITLNYFKTWLDEYRKEYNQTKFAPDPATGRPTSNQQNIITRLNNASVTLENNTSFKNASLSSYNPFKTMLGTLLGLKNENIFMYTRHCYNVDHVQLVGTKKEDLNHSDLGTVMKSLDIKASTVTMQNPHGTGKATFHKPEDRPVQGNYDVSLEEFLINVQFVTTATVKHNSKK